MEFGSDPNLEAQVGRVCLVFARVEQEAGHVVQAAHGNWDLAGSRDYLDYSSASQLLLAWLQDVGRAYVEVQLQIADLCQGLLALKRSRDEWAHSAAVIDAFLLMKEQGAKAQTFPALDSEVKLLNSRRARHSRRPTDSDISAFLEEASKIGDAAQALAARIAQLVEESGVRTVRKQNS